MTALQLLYVETNRSRHGKVYYYFRWQHKRIARLPDNPDSPAFLEAYLALRSKHEGKKVTSASDAGPQAGTFHTLCAAYLTSDAYRRLDATTQLKRRHIIDGMMREPLKPNTDDKRVFGQIPLTVLTTMHIEGLRDRKASTPFAADERLKVLRQVFETTKPGGKDKHVKENLARQVAPFRRKTEGHHTLRDEEISQYVQFHGLQSKAVLALVIMLYTGMRVSDLALIGPQHRKGDLLRFRVFKNRNSHPTELTMPVHPILSEVLAMHSIKGLRYLMTDFGKPFSIKGLGNRVSDWFTQADLPHCSAHSVRKGLATSLAEHEATDSMLDGLFGWKDGKTSKIYTQKKVQAKLAHQAISKVNWAEFEGLVPNSNAGLVPSAKL